MTMKRFIGILFILLLLVVSCLYIYRKQIVGHYVPQFEREGEIGIEIVDDTVHVNSRISIRNKTFFEIELDSVSYDISLLDKSYIRNQKVITVKLAAYEKDSFNFSLGIPYLTIIKELKDERITNDSADFSIGIILHFITPLGKLDIPFNKSGKFKIPNFPLMKIVDINFKKVRPNEISAVIDIKVNNSTRSDIILNNLRYHMDIYRAGSVSGYYEQPIVLKPESATIVSLPISITPKNFGKTIIQIALDKDDYYYQLILKADLEAKGPIKDTFKIEVVRNGKLELKKDGNKNGRSK